MRTLLVLAASFGLAFSTSAQKFTNPPAIPDAQDLPAVTAGALDQLEFGTARVADQLVDRQPVTLRPLTVSGGPLLTRAAKTPGAFPLDSRFRVTSAPDGTVRWLEGDLGRLSFTPGKAARPDAVSAGAMDVLVEHRAVLGLDDPADELKPWRVEVDEVGHTHARFEQVYQGLPVWGRDLYVHFDETGAAYALNGTYEATPRGLDTKPALAAATADQAVIDDLKQLGRWQPLAPAVAEWLGVEDEAPRLVVYPMRTGETRLAYEVTRHASLVERYTYLIDAQTGDVLNRIAQHCALHNHGEAPDLSGVTLQVPEAPAEAHSHTSGAFTTATGVDLNGVQQQMRVFEAAGGPFYMLWDLPNIDISQLNLPSDLHELGGGTTITAVAPNTDFNENVQLQYVQSGSNAWNDPASVSAHVNMEVSYRYFNQTFGRRAIDDRDQSIVSIIHVSDQGQGMDNAFWTGRFMVYGDGATTFKPLAGGLDVAAHEMSHGVIEHTAGLVYEFQSGALNESYADVFGVMVDREDFAVGEDVARNARALRDIANPGAPDLIAQQPRTMSEFFFVDPSTPPTPENDNGGVHINSGITNHAAYLSIQAL
ncbi:MAG: M4 family metallopeptidase, partial [Bacteroidota bacterium]